MKNSQSRNLSLDYLRSILMVLVVVHHSLLAYTESGYGAQINDYNNFKGFEGLLFYNDNFFMFLF